ncbi:zinc-binding alcohol dehydrogenase family protein [Clostridium sp. AM58-1XD]|uniref:zinc-dependent alcohol dehydrogenase n=1 Tax=Clostridium sp. AM58-1XD TaxID=2292307 RepID=UPI000E549AEC|nr:zinc-binding alcohol dehydrogenase family protein [Clostridium sp. AM58-1XD]RGY97489.1 alcohol dehydrogenase [Clostridium sp. AM58-1XD]
MKGIYIEEPGKIEIKEIEEPQAKAGEALIEIKSVGICGSDVTALKGANPTMTYPRIMGHEAAGVIKEIGENAKGLKAGDKVALEPYFYCGECYACRKGIFNNCENLNVLGVRMEGAMAERVSHPVKYLHKLPDDMTWEEAAAVEPLSISLHGVHRTNVRGGEFVAIFGAGTIGLLAALCCKAYGAKPILMDVMDERLAFARKQGVEYTINPAKEDAIEAIRNLTGGDMAPVVLECSGSQKAINDAMEVVSNSGRIGLVGWAKGVIDFNQPRVLRKELNIFGSRCSYNEFPECIDMIYNKRVDVMPLIDVRNSIEDTMQGFKDLMAAPEKYLKIVGVF